MKRLLPALNKNTQFGYFFFFVVFIRLILNGVVPLMDKTEARYSEIARLMVETGEWIVPQIDYGIPFWAKPPLSTWASALSIQFFGDAEFFVRLPYAIICIVMALFLGRYARGQEQSFFLPGFILLTLPEFFLHLGVVSTDVFLAFSISLVMLSFWEGIQAHSKSFWRYLFFVGMGLGLLAKGPIVGVLTVPPIVLWCFFNKTVFQQLKKFPWVLGSLLTLIMALPWYWLAEMRSPGFIDYFFVGEHFKRYVDANWAGDKYGFPKNQPLGMIWLFLMGAILPYAFLLIKKTITYCRVGKPNAWVTYLLFWLLWTPLFFTVSKSLIHPYTLPVMVPAALLIVHFWDTISRKRTLIYAGMAFPVLAIAVYFSGHMDRVFQTNSDKYLVTPFANKTLYTLNSKSFSSQFYSRGKIRLISAEDLVQNEDTLTLLITNKQMKQLNDTLTARLICLKAAPKKGIYQYATKATHSP